MPGNPCCPDQLTPSREVDGNDYARYRLYVISRLSSLEFLDYTEITVQERSKAKHVGEFQVVRQFNELGNILFSKSMRHARFQI